MTWAQIDDVAVELGRDIAFDSTEGRQIGKWLRRAEMMIRNRIPVLDEWCRDERYQEWNPPPSHARRSTLRA